MLVEIFGVGRDFFGAIKRKIVISISYVFLTGREGIIPSRCVCNSKGKETAYSKLVFSVPLGGSEANLI